jgi:hypothetical protein
VVKAGKDPWFTALQDGEEVAEDQAVVGLWVAGIPDQMPSSYRPDEAIKEATDSRVESCMKHPLVWQACANFTLRSSKHARLSSASTGKNTFLVCHLNSLKRPQFYEFKIARNPSEEQAYANSWVVLYA